MVAPCVGGPGDGGPDHGTDGGGGEEDGKVQHAGLPDRHCEQEDVADHRDGGPEGKWCH